MINRNFWIVFPILVVVNLTISLVRASLVNARLPFLINLRENHPAGAERALKLLETPRTRAALRLVVAISHFLLSAALAWFVVESTSSLPTLGRALAVAALLALVVAALEFSLEGLILRNLEEWTIRLSPLARLLDWLMLPFSWLYLQLWGSVGALQGRQPTEMEEELKNWVEVGQPEGSLEKDERRMIYSIFQFSETLCREIMIPRIDVIALDVNTSVSDAVTVMRKWGHSRLPVYEDTIDNILGLLYAKDLLRVVDGDAPVESIRQLLRPAYFVPEAKKADDLLAEMQARRFHMAVVVDEYGGVAGLVTLEDIVEEIVGEIRDEYDQAEEQRYQQVGPEEYLFNGLTGLDDVNDLLGTHLERESADTLGGYIAAEIGRVPTGGEQVNAEDWILTVEQVSGRRIRRVRVRRMPPVEPVEEKNDDAKR